jgi:D-lactate dehydrogenase (cytochrome)
MQFSVDPGADATIGGMVATGASGTTAVRYGTVRYGTMRENILALECVLPDAEATVVRAGTLALKSSASYDLVSLMCGSEGTLGVITSVTVKLHAIPERVLAAVCVFDSPTDAAQAVAAIKLAEIPITRCELLDASSVQAFNAHISSSKDGDNTSTSSSTKKTKPMQVKPTLFLESTTWRFQLCFLLGRTSALWSARHDLLNATIAMRPDATSAFITDACVPLSHFATLIAATAKDLEEKGIVGPCFGHASDGNLHCILPLLEDESDEYLAKVHQVNENFVVDWIGVLIGSRQPQSSWDLDSLRVVGILDRI